MCIVDQAIVTVSNGVQMKTQHYPGFNGLIRLVWGLVIFLAMGIAQAADKQAIGWLEPVYLGEAKMLFIAKIDTGADNSSIKAKVLKKFKREGVEWIRFKVQDKQGHTAVIERKVVRYTKIKRKMAPSIKRPVVMLGVCLGKVYRDIEVNLAERKKFKYHMLIGRNFLRGIFLVDSELKYSTKAACPGILND